MQTFIGIILGGGFLTFLQFLIQRHDKKYDRFIALEKQIAEITSRITAIDEKGDRREAENRRVRILRFEDELQDNRRHSKDSFDQVMTDIKGYRDYCGKHPEFQNGITEPSAKHIEKVYYERLEKHDFL